MNALLLRSFEHAGCTPGFLLLESGLRFATLEPPWRDNARNVSCIPQGSYVAGFLPRSASGKYKNCWHVRGVEGRSGILIHNGNIVNHTRGCILLGMKQGMLAGQPAVLQSRIAMRRLLRAVGREDLHIEVVGGYYA